MIDRLLEAREALNARAGEGIKISVNDMIIRAAAMALIAVPEANASWEGDNTRIFRHADIAMAVAIDGGLITPIVWAAEQKGLAALSQVTADLAARARDGKLTAGEYTGGSFTISNLGMFGIREFAAVINPPHGGILAVGAGEQRPVVIDGNSGRGNCDERYHCQPIIALLTARLGPNGCRLSRGLLKAQSPCFCNSSCNSPDYQADRFAD